MSATTNVHLARLLLLIDSFSGADAGGLDGLTKLAKLDFLVRYPVFLEQLLPADLSINTAVLPTPEERQATEAPMIRYKYGPWDEHYYEFIGDLVGRGLVEFVPGRGRAAFRSTALGGQTARAIAAKPEWESVAARVRFLRDNFDLPGTQLKTMIYDRFPAVGRTAMRATIGARPDDEQ